MKAERDNAPYQVQRRGHNRHLRFLAILGVCSATFWTLVFMFAKPITIDLTQLKKAFIIDGQAEQPSPPTRKPYTIPAPQIKVEQSATVTRVDQARPQTYTRQVLSGHWSWESYYGQFTWTETNGRIEWESVCSNKGHDTAIYRACRLGAKATFNRMCSYYRPACRAHHHYNPL